jgi:glycine cleavage system H protein
LNIPAELKYTKEHEWLRLDGKVATIGITDYAQSELGDIVFVELPRVGQEVRKMEPFGTIEAVKAVSELFSPVSGRIVEINSALENDPMAVNHDAYGEGWMIKIDIADSAELDNLLSSDEYLKLVG